MLTTFSILAQKTVDVEQLVKAEPFKLSGGISTDMMYSESDIDQSGTALKYQYFIKGNLAATFFGQLTVPLAFSYSNRTFDTRYPQSQQSFNRFGIKPKYKWVTLHAGWSNMRFSKYSLNGHSFVGGGVEMEPGNYEIKAMYGRLLKAVAPYDSILNRGNRPVFERWGSGFQVVRKNKGNQYGVSVFRSADKYNSISSGLDSLGVTPEENIVTSFNISQKVNDVITVSAEYSTSQLTRDSRIGESANSFFTNNIGIHKNSSTKKYHALKTDIGFRVKKMNLGLGYERIAPGYKTHGAYFFNNDLENFTFSFASPLFKDKLNVNTSFGLERDNLDGDKANSANRVIGQLNVSWMASEKLQFNGNYSNFRNISEFNPYAGAPVVNPYDNIDSLRYVQVSQNTTLNMTYTTNTETLGQSFMVMLAMMQSEAELGGVAQNSGADYYNSSIVYNANFVPKNISATLSCNLNWMVMPEQQNGMVGPSMGLNALLFKLINSGWMYTWNASVGEGESSGNVHRFQYIASYVLKEKHNFNFSAVWMNRGVAIASAGKSRNNTYLLRFGYSYSF
jgi:hypothetical protein